MAGADADRRCQSCLQATRADRGVGERAVPCARTPTGACSRRRESLSSDATSRDHTQLPARFGVTCLELCEVCGVRARSAALLHDYEPLDPFTTRRRARASRGTASLPLPGCHSRTRDFFTASKRGEGAVSGEFRARAGCDEQSHLPPGGEGRVRGGSRATVDSAPQHPGLSTQRTLPLTASSSDTPRRSCGCASAPACPRAPSRSPRRRARE